MLPIEIKKNFFNCFSFECTRTFPSVIKLPIENFVISIGKNVTDGTKRFFEKNYLMSIG